MSYSREYDAAELDELPVKLRGEVQRFLVAASLIDLDDDGLPCNPDQALEVFGVMASLASRLVHQLRSPDGTPMGTVRRLADELGCLIAAHAKGGRHPGMGRRWLAARAKAADVLGPSQVTVPDDLAGIDAPTSVHVDAHGRLWCELDPDDEQWSDEQVAALQHCVGCREPMVPGVDHSGCHRTVA